MSNHQTVSVIIPTYNRACYVKEAVKSVLGQTYPHIETIVIDDGSTDDTEAVLKEFQGRIRYIRQKHSERSTARNRGIQEAKGSFIAFLDSDDWWHPEKIEKQIAVFQEDAEAGVVYTDVKFMDKNGDPHPEKLCWDERRRQSFYEDLMTNNVVTGSTSSVLIRRRCFKDVGFFDEDMNACEDFDLYRRIARYYSFRKVPLPLVYIRIHDSNTQSNLVTMAQGWETIIEKIWRETPPRHRYYRNEATIKDLSKIWSLYKECGQIHRFFLYCYKSNVSRPRWLLRSSFWKTLARMVKERSGMYQH